MSSATTDSTGAPYGTELTEGPANNIWMGSLLALVGLSVVLQILFFTVT